MKKINVDAEGEDIVAAFDAMYEWMKHHASGDELKEGYRRFDSVTDRVARFLLLVAKQTPDEAERVASDFAGAWRAAMEVRGIDTRET